MKANLKFLFFYIVIFKANALRNKKNNIYFLQKTKESSFKDDPYDIEGMDVIYYANGTCTERNCDKCVSNTLCQCPKGYAHDPSEPVTSDAKSCQYKQKKQWVYFLLELLFPFGVGHFYAGKTLYGVIKLLSLAIIVACDFILKRNVKAFKTKQNIGIVMMSLYFAYIAWQMIDLIIIGVNQYKDGKGIKFTTLH